MLALSPASPRNILLAALSPADLGLLRPHLEPVALALRKVLERPNRRIDAVYFPERGFASVVAIQHRSPHTTYIQAAGDGQCIRATELRKAMDAKDSIRGLFLKYVQAFVVQTAHTAICNARAKLDQRLARWILMAHDRLGVDTLPLTHEFLSLMLGVRRAGVTEAMQALEGRGLIRCARGQIVVRDRKGIERSAGGSYGVPEAEFRRLIG